VDSFSQISDAVILKPCSADILDRVAKVEVQSLVSDEVPNLNGASLVVTGACEVGVGHFLTRFDIELPSRKH